MTARPANRFVVVCDHCGDSYHRRFLPGRSLEPLPAGWRRVEVGAVGDYVTECPDCAIAWDVEQFRHRRPPFAACEARLTDHNADRCNSRFGRAAVPVRVRVKARRRRR